MTLPSDPFPILWAEDLAAAVGAGRPRWLENEVPRDGKSLTRAAKALAVLEELRRREAVEDGPHRSTAAEVQKIFRNEDGTASHASDAVSYCGIKTLRPFIVQVMQEMQAGCYCNRNTDPCRPSRDDVRVARCGYNDTRNGRRAGRGGRMADRVTLVLCILASGGGFGLVGVAFGALAGRSAWQHGHPGGGFLGRYFLNALNRVRQEDVPAETAAVLCGAIDGGVFLMGIGGVVGAWAALSLAEPAPWLLLAFGAMALLAGVAAVFGLIAYGLVRVPDVRTIGLVGVVGLLGALVGSWVVGEDGILPGTGVGAVLGLFAGALMGREGKRRDPEQENPP